MSDVTPPARTWVINCDCGVTIRGGSDDEIVERGQGHAKSAHGLTVTREQLLALAEPAD